MFRLAKQKSSKNHRLVALIGDERGVELLQRMKSYRSRTCDCRKRYSKPNNRKQKHNFFDFKIRHVFLMYCQQSYPTEVERSVGCWQ